MKLLIFIIALSFNIVTPKTEGGNYHSIASTSVSYSPPVEKNKVKSTYKKQKNKKKYRKKLKSDKQKPNSPFHSGPLAGFLIVIGIMLGLGGVILIIASYFVAHMALPFFILGIIGLVLMLALITIGVVFITKNRNRDRERRSPGDLNGIE